MPARTHEKQLHPPEEAQVQRRDESVSLQCPLRQHEAIGTFPPNDRAQSSKDEQWQSRGECIDEQTLNSCNCCNIRICKQDSRSECYSYIVSMNCQLVKVVTVMVVVVAALGPASINLIDS